MSAIIDLKLQFNCIKFTQIQWHQCSQQVIPVLHSLISYAVSTAAKVCSMLLLKEWQMETTSLQDMRHITELWVEANWQDCRCIVATFEQRVNDLVKATDDSLYRMYLADAIFCMVSLNRTILLKFIFDLSHLNQRKEAYSNTHCENILCSTISIKKKCGSKYKSSLLVWQALSDIETYFKHKHIGNFSKQPWDTQSTLCNLNYQKSKVSEIP